MNVALKINSLMNLTTAIDVLKNHGPTEVTDFGADEFVAYVPQLIRENAMIELKCTLSIGNSMQQLAITGKVLSCREITKGSFQIKVHLRQYEKPIWAEILKIAERNQTKADTLFTAIKGES